MTVFKEFRFDADGQMYAAFDLINEISSELQIEIEKDIERYKDISKLKNVIVREDGSYIHVNLVYEAHVVKFSFWKNIGDIEKRVFYLFEIKEALQDLGHELVKKND